MKELNLIRQDHNRADIEVLDHTIQELNEILARPEGADNAELRRIIDFQDTDGSFKLLDSYRVESDIRVDYCHMPTYLCTAVIMKAYLKEPACLTGKEEHILVPALTMCCARGLNGHGFDDLSGQIAAVRIFIRAGVQEFINRYPTLCPEFTMMINSIVDEYRAFIKEQKFVFYFGEDHEKDFYEIVAHFQEAYYIFVYGTLMKGQYNYDRYLAPQKACASAVLNGYRMFDVGSFPGIIQGNGKVKGEIYRVNACQLASIDRLEGEGTLYIRTQVTVSVNDEQVLHAYTYVYNGGTKGLAEIPYENQPYGKPEYVWYVSYGSNLLTERLRCYIEGGTCIFNGRQYNGCKDKRMPEKSIAVTIPYDMYYSNYNMGSWKNSAVCFLDVTKPGESFGRAWLITHEQLKDIHRCEGKGSNWYPERIQLDDIEGIPAYTFTTKEKKQHEPFSRVSKEYQSVLKLGMLENCPDMTGKKIEQYLMKCGG